MFKHHDLVLDQHLKKDTTYTFDLKSFVPLGKIGGNNNLTFAVSFDGKNYQERKVTSSFNDENIRYLKVHANEETQLKIYCGLGYIATPNKEMSAKFERRSGWSGGDGIYSFNLDNQMEDYNQVEDNTLFVFGDTFVGEVDKNKRRLDPTAMINSSLMYYQKGKTKFVYKKGKNEICTSIFTLDKNNNRIGNVCENLTNYAHTQPLKPYTSAFKPKKDIRLLFDLNGIHHVKRLEITNYYDQLFANFLNNERGVEQLTIRYGNDKGHLVDCGTFSLKRYPHNETDNEIVIDKECRYIEFIISKKTMRTNIVGLTKVKFFNEKNNLLYDVATSANSEFFPEYMHSWYWLQDGIILNDAIYLFPVIVEQELNGVEGYEFRITGTALLKCPIKNKKLAYDKNVARRIPLHDLYENKEYISPGGIMDQRKVDGYLYFYGYYYDRPTFTRYMIVARIKPEHIEDMNHLEHFDGTTWQHDMRKAKPLVAHVSSELSVQPIVAGENKGKYLAVFQYDTNGPLTAYSIGETPWGPFSEPRIIYRAPEVDKYNKTTYTYNAKAHLHLSTPQRILVSYNVNDMSMQANKENGNIYHPRFLDFVDTSK